MKAKKSLKTSNLQRFQGQAPNFRIPQERKEERFLGE